MQSLRKVEPQLQFLDPRRMFRGVKEAIVMHEGLEAEDGEAVVRAEGVDVARSGYLGLVPGCRIGEGGAGGLGWM